MASSGDLEGKYQKLASEYSKVHYQATVLKKAVLDEQAKSAELREIINQHDQTIRKYGQEMDSLTFRNEQLTKRITVLQQELQVNNHPKKSRNKAGENVQVYSAVLDEELQKRILENAQLVSSMADKEYELIDCRDRIHSLETQLATIEHEIEIRESKYLAEIDRLQQSNSKSTDSTQEIPKTNDIKHNTEEEIYWKKECERWRRDCELLRAKPSDQLSEYYEAQLEECIKDREVAQSEARTLWAENRSLYERLENLALVNNNLQSKFHSCNEELQTTTENYKSQLDAMTEHLAAQNDKITKQCDEIQALRHKPNNKK